LAGTSAKALQKGKEKSEEDIIQDREKGKKDRNKEK
jgi:hypothetical protein